MSPNKQRAYDAMLEALIHARDELHRVNAAHACVRPDVTYVVMQAIARGQDHVLSA
jgi:hypothetical protein